MPRCEVCENDYDKAFEVIVGGERHIFDSFECAIHALAPVCPHCNCRIAKGVVLDSCVMANGVEIAEPVELRNVLICRDDEPIPREEGYRREHGLIFLDI